MRLKVFRAASMTEAMAQLRAALGEDALILSARTLRDGVELTAGLDTPAAPAADPRPVIWPARAATALPHPDDAAVHAALARHAVPAAVGRAVGRMGLAAGLAASLQFAPIAADAGPLLFVGQPGAGKTSTVARLATRLVLGGARPLVITADGRRAGATEQLAAYTRLLGLHLVVATHPDPLARALARRERGQPVLIDAPGSNVHTAAELQELAQLAGAVGGRMALVLPAGLDAAEAAEVADGHAAAGATLMVANRLDLARRLGSVLGAAAGRLALAEAGIGPGAADGLSAMSPGWLAARLMQGADPTPRASQGNAERQA